MNASRKRIYFFHKLFNQELEISKILRDIILVFSSAIGLIILIYTLSEVFGIGTQWFQRFWPNYIYLIILHILVSALILSFIKYYLRVEVSSTPNNSGENENNNQLAKELVKVIESSYKQKSYREVIRFGTPLSRPLLISGLHYERAQIGEIIADAASKEGLIEEQVVALIDSIGWSNVLMGNLDKAEKNIFYGVQVAIKNRLFYYAAKGERHLAGICQRNHKDLSEALTHFEEALKLTEEISDSYSKNEMKAGILFGKADLLIQNKEFEEALKYSEESKEILESIGGQEERVVKTFSQLGEIYLGLKQLQKAEDIFHKGYREAALITRPDEMAENLLGLGKVFLLNEDYSNALESLNEAIAIFDKKNMPHELRIATVLKSEAEFKNKKPK